MVLPGCAARLAREIRIQAPAVPVAPTPCLVADTSAPARDTVYVVGLLGPAIRDCEDHPIVAGTLPVVVTLTPLPGADLRDVLDHGMGTVDHRRPDAVFTRDPDLVEYARERGEYLVAALPWDRTYVLAAKDSLGSLNDADRSELANDAVRGEARGDTRFYPWGGDMTCSYPRRTPAATAPAVVAFAATDDMARQLAERIVALAEGSRRPAWIPRSLGNAPRILPVAADSAEAALASGRAAAAIYPITAHSLLGCFGYGLSGLVDSRATAIIRRGSGAAFIVGSDGSLTFTRRGAP